MASTTVGVLIPWLGSSTPTAPVRGPARAASSRGGFRLGSMVGGAGAYSISGYAHDLGANVIRNIVIMTQPPRPVVIAEFKTTIGDGTFSFPNLPAGNYMVIDSLCDNSKQALVYDWVVAA